MHVATCSKFLIDVSKSPHPSTCIKTHTTTDPNTVKDDELDEFAEYDPEGTLSKLNSKGYR